MGSAPATAGGLFVYEVGTDDVGLAAAGYSARAQDASTVLTNPAGMTRLEGKQFLLGAQALRADIKFSGTNGTSAALGSANGGYMVGEDGWFPGGGVFFTHGVSQDVKVGIAATGNFGNSLKYDDNWVGRYYGQQASMMGLSLLPSVAWRVNDRLSLGASVNAMYGYMKNVVAINNVPEAVPDGKLVLRDTTWGFGGNLGLLYEATPGTRFGLTWNSRVKLDFSPQAQFSGTGPILGGLLNARGIQGAAVNMDITVPQQVMGSVFHTVNDRLALMANVGWQDWSRFGQVEINVTDTTNPASLTTQLGFKDTWHVALGGQYRLSDPWQLNFGVSYDSEFQSSSNVSPLLPTNDSWRIGVGGRNHVSKTFNWGVAAEYIYGGTTNVSKQSAVPVALGGRGNVVGSYDDMGVLYMSASFNWKF